MKCEYCCINDVPKSKKKYCSKICYERAKATRHYKKCGRGAGKCDYCGKDFICHHSKDQKYCSQRCAANARKKYLDIPDCLEKSGRSIDKNIGYVRIYMPMHPEANNRGYVYEHRIIAEEKIDRRLKKGEVVHHKNGIRWDNNAENLEVMDRIKHSKLKNYRAVSSHSYKVDNRNGKLKMWVQIPSALLVKAL